MANKIRYRFDINQEPWLRPQYYTNNNVSLETIVPSLKVDFQEDIKDEFIAEVHRQNVSNRFPRDSDISVSIEVSSINNVLLPMAIKNALDALSGHAFVDDVNVSSIYAAMTDEKENSIKIGLYLSKRLNLKEKPFIMFRLNTKPIDQIVALPKYPSQTVKVNPENIRYQSIVKNLVNKQKNHSIIRNDIVINFDIETISARYDIDNIVLNYLYAMKGIVFEDIYKIKVLCMNIKRHISSNESAVVTIEELRKN